MQTLARVWLKAGREKKIRTHYPWVQKEEVKRSEPCESGSVGELYSESGEFLATGFINIGTRFPFRVLSLEREAINEGFFVRRFRRARDLRLASLTLEGPFGVRWVFAEADGLSGLIVDEYNGVLVVQVRNAGMSKLKDAWLPALIEVFQPVAIYEKSEMESRQEEGLGPEAGVLYGALPEHVVIREGGLEFEVPIVDGLKTGFYLDQRDTRAEIARHILPGQRVLDTFCYVGAFGAYCAKAGGSTLGVDISPVAVESARANLARNHLKGDILEGNAFDFLEQTTDRFDWIILDPPAIAKARDKRDSLKWAIWKLTHRAIDKLQDGGTVIVCSCSYQVNLQILLETVRLAASDRGKRALLEQVTIQSPDHPVSLAFPESWYLKCAWCKFV